MPYEIGESEFSWCIRPVDPVFGDAGDDSLRAVSDAPPVIQEWANRLNYQVPFLYRTENKNKQPLENRRGADATDIERIKDFFVKKIQERYVAEVTPSAIGAIALYPAHPLLVGYQGVVWFFWFV